MPAKLVTDRQKSATAVGAAATTHAARVAKSFTETLSPVLKKNQSPPDIEGLMLTVAEWLANAASEMVKTDEAHTHELSDDDEPRRRRDEAQAALYEELVSLRDLINGFYGAAATRMLGFSSGTPRDATALSRFAGEVSKALREKELPAPKRADTTVKWSPAKTADEIDKLRKKLDEALTDVAREIREAQGTLVNKNDALDAYDSAFSRTANLLAGLFMFAGETALAERVRPSTRRLGQTEELAPPAEEPALGEEPVAAEEEPPAEVPANPPAKPAANAAPNPAANKKKPKSK